MPRDWCTTRSAGNTRRSRAMSPSAVTTPRRVLGGTGPLVGIRVLLDDQCRPDPVPFSCTTETHDLAIDAGVQGVRSQARPDGATVGSARSPRGAPPDDVAGVSRDRREHAITASRRAGRALGGTPAHPRARRAAVP